MLLYISGIPSYFLLRYFDDKSCFMVQQQVKRIHNLTFFYQNLSLECIFDTYFSIEFGRKKTGMKW